MKIILGLLLSMAFIAYSAFVILCLTKKVLPFEIFVFEPNFFKISKSIIFSSDSKPFNTFSGMGKNLFFTFLYIV